MKKNSFYLITLLALLIAGCDKCDPPSGQPVADFDVIQSTSCAAPCEICFTNTSIDAESYSWDFGNGQTSTLASPCVVYTTNGSYTVTLTATGGGQTSTQTKQIVISNSSDNVLRFKQLFNFPNHTATHTLVTRNRYIYTYFTQGDVPGYSRLLRYGPFSNTGSNYNISYIDTPNSYGVNDLVEDTDNNVLIAGVQNESAMLRKCTPSTFISGGYFFNRSYKFQGVATSSGQSVTPTTDGGYMVVGGKAAWNTGDTGGGYVVKTDAEGNKVSEDFIQIGNQSDDAIKRVFSNPGGIDPYLGIGLWTDPWQNKRDILLSRISATGSTATTGSDLLGLENHENDGVNDAVQFGNNQYALVGKYNGNVALMIFTYNGGTTIQQFNTVINFPSLYVLNSICKLDNNQGFAVVGVTEQSKIYVAKLNTLGQIIWEKAYGDGTGIVHYDIAHTFWDEGFVVTGAELCTSGCVFQPLMMKMDKNGNIE